MGCKHGAEFRCHVFSGKKVLPRDGLIRSGPAFAIDAVIRTGLEGDKVNAKR
jgi:hypothetical protein